MKEYDAYLFDADGTLIDTRELIYQSFLHMAAVLGVPEPSREAVDAAIGLPIKPQLEMFAGAGRPAEEYEKAYDIYNTYHMRIYPRLLRLFPGVAEGLAKLRDMGKKLAVVSSRSKSSLEVFLATTGIRDFFQVVVAADDTARHKPHPDPALKGLELLGVGAARAVFVGDAEFDMSCAKAAGLDTVYVSWGGMDYCGWPVQPDLRIKAFSQLLPEK